MAGLTTSLGMSPACIQMSWTGSWASAEASAAGELPTRGVTG
jgi:hypothetical protein